MTSDSFSWLQEWYRRQADGDWEHQYGIKIETIDNPGWSVGIDLSETDLALVPFSGVEIERTESDWVHCRVEGEKFNIACGPGNLNEALNIFRRWVETVEVNSEQPTP